VISSLDRLLHRLQSILHKVNSWTLHRSVSTHPNLGERPKQELVDFLHFQHHITLQIIMTRMQQCDPPQNLSWGLFRGCGAVAGSGDCPVNIVERVSQPGLVDQNICPASAPGFRVLEQLFALTEVARKLPNSTHTPFRATRRHH
jgi:hypothetical protein